MAELLKRWYDVIVLKVELPAPPQGGQELRFTLQAGKPGELDDELTWTAGLDTLGLSREAARQRQRDGADPEVRLPPQMLDELRGWLTDRELTDRTLWVHLVKPYGDLRFVAWERSLGAAVDGPVLMLPDFIFPPPREAAGILDVALCATTAAGADGSSIQLALGQAAERILEAQPRQTRLHLFADRPSLELARRELEANGWLDAGYVRFYEPPPTADAHAAGADPPRTAGGGLLRSPWLAWMREALRGTSVDVAHFIGHGYLLRDRGSLLLPVPGGGAEGQAPCAPVGAPELHTFLTQLGAWATCFTCVADNASPAGLRALADEIAQTRPGPMLMHSLREDPAGDALRDGYGFLFAEYPVPVPRSTALFIYCQPYLDPAGADLAPPIFKSIGAQIQVLGVDAGHHRLPPPNMRAAAAAPRPDSSRGTDALFASGTAVGGWVASTERFADQVQLELQQLMRAELMPEEHRDMHSRVTERTLAALRDAVAEEEMADLRPVATRQHDIEPQEI